MATYRDQICSILDYFSGMREFTCNCSEPLFRISVAAIHSSTLLDTWSNGI